jgi:hypothetical protein
MNQEGCCKAKVVVQMLMMVGELMVAVLSDEWKVFGGGKVMMACGRMTKER